MFCLKTNDMLSVVIIAKNEAHHIRRCLESVQWADELIVLDSGSTDNTVAIAREYTSHVMQTDWQGYGVQKQRALSYATGDWVLNLDADECVSEPLKNELNHAMNSTLYDAYRVPIKLCFYGKILRFSSSPKRHIRLFNNHCAYFIDDIVHEKIVLPDAFAVGQLKQSIIHHSFKDVTHVLDKINRYSSYSAKIRLEKKTIKPFSVTILGSFWMFFRSYILQGGLWDGREGFLFAVFNALGTFFRGVKQIYPDLDQEALPVVLKEENA